MNTRPVWEQMLKVGESELHGKGIIASVDIPESEIIMIIDGEVIDEKECIRREEEENNVYIFWNGDNYIDCAMQEKIKYLNHLCDPNCYVDDRDETSLNLVSARPIKAGEEITIDYAYDEIYDHCTCDTCENKVKS